MTRIYLICAAESESDLYRIAQGHLQTDLTERGQRQVQALGKSFASLPIECVYTSDLSPARATAGAISTGTAIQQRTDLRELCLGEWEGNNWGNIAYHQMRQVEYFKTALHKWSVRDAEAPAQASRRMLQALREIAAENEGKSVAFTSHPFAIRLLLAELQGIPLDEIHQLPLPQNAAVSMIRADGNALHLVEQSDADLLGVNKLQRQVPDFDTDMYFYPLPWLTYNDTMADAVQCVWQEAGEDRMFDKNILLNDASMRTTIIGFVEHEPAGFLQMGMDPGRISLLCTHPGCRNLGLGAQLIGQAVMLARSKGEASICITLPKKNPYRSFFLNHGFVSTGKTPEGRELLEKDIRFEPEAINQ